MDHGEEGNAEAPPRSGSRSNSLTGSAALDDDSNLSNRTLSDDIPSPVHRLQGSASSAAMSLASAAKSKLSIGGRKLLSPLTAAASAANNAAQGSTKSASTESTATPASSTDDPLSPTPAADSAQAFRQVSVQQRMQILEELVQYRRSDWNYLKAMHEGSNYWFNIALLREQQVLAHLGEKQTLRRSLQFYYLGLGLGKIIGELQHPQFLAMEGCQLLEELEFYFSSTTVQSMKLMVATSSTLHEPYHVMANEQLHPTDEPFRPVIHKWNQRAVFRRLVTPHVPFPLDYREIMLSLCDILAITYSKLVEETSSWENIYFFQAIVRFDERIKKLVIDPVKKEFSAVATAVVTDELTSVRKKFGSLAFKQTATASTSTSPTTSAAPTPASPTAIAPASST